MINRLLFLVLSYFLLTSYAIGADYEFEDSYVCGTRNSNEIRAKVKQISGSQITFRIAATSMYSSCNASDTTDKFSSNGKVYLFRGLPSTFNTVLASQNYTENNSYVDLNHTLSISSETPFYLAIQCSQFEGYCYTDPIDIKPITPTTGELTVTIIPTEAKLAGAQWRLSGFSSWKNHDDLLTQIPTGSYSLEFKTLTDWVTPSNQAIQINSGSSYSKEGKYVSNKKFSVAGKVSLDGIGVGGVDINFANYQAVTTSDGQYSIDNISPSTSGYVTPTKTNYSFSPLRSFIAPINSDRTELNFIANQDTAQINVAPINLDFSETTVGVRSESQNFQINNIGAQPLSISSITIPEGFEVVDFTDGVIASGQSQIVNVAFVPESAKSYSDKIIINSNATNAGGKTVSVTGIGKADGAVFQGMGHLLGDPNNHAPAISSAGFGVNAVTGNFYYGELDVAMPGKDIGFAFARAYNSMVDGTDSFGEEVYEPLGPGWTHSYNILLRIKDNQAEIIWGDGSRDEFVKTNALWSAVTPNNRSQLSQDGNDWVVTTYKQSQYRFNSAGQLTRIQSRHENAVTLDYSGKLLTGITDTAGRQVIFGYTNMMLTSLNLPLGLKILYGYTAGGLLNTVTDRRGNVWRYAYQDDHLRVIHRAGVNATAAGDNNKLLLKIAYDDEGRVRQQDTGHTATTEGTGTHSFQWNSSSMTYNSPTGQGATYQWDGQSRLTSVITINTPADTAPLTRKYSKKGVYSFLPDRLQDRKGSTHLFNYAENTFDLSKVTDSIGRVSELTHNTQHDLEKVDSPNGLTTDISWLDQSPKTITFSGNGLNNPVSTSMYSIKGELKTSLIGNQQTYVSQRDKDGQPSTILSRTKSGQTLAQENLVYDDLGRLISSHNSLTNSYRCLSYDANDNPEHIVSGVSVCPPELDGVIATASVGHTYQEYDADNRIQKQVVAFNSAQAQTYTQEYNDNTGMLSRSCHQAGGQSRCHTYQYDNDLRLYETTEESTGRKNRVHTLQSGFLRTTSQNAAGTLKRIERREFDVNGNLKVISSCNNIEAANKNNPHADCEAHQERKRVKYDSLNRPIKIFTQLTSTIKRVTTINYSTDGRTVTISEPEGNKLIRESDVLGRLIRVTESHNGKSQTSRYEYDDNDNLIKITDPSGLHTSFTYDGLGRRLSRTDLSGKKMWLYPDGLTTVLTESDNTSITYLHDVSGNLINVTTSDGFTAEYTYNALGQKVTASWSGYGQSGQRSYTYNSFGQLDIVTSPSSVNVDYDHDDATGLLVSKRYAGLDLKYGYNDLNQLESMSGSAGNFKFYHDGFNGALLKQDFPNGVETTYQRNLAGELTKLSSNRGSNRFLDYNLTLDGNGRRSRINGDQPQIMQTEPMANLSFDFTKEGLLEKLNGSSVSYDDRGNLLSIPSPFKGTYNYDAFNRVQSNGTIQHEYDDTRRRIAKTDGDIATRYLWDLNTTFGDVVAEYNGDTLDKRYVYAAGGLLAQIDADDTVHYVHQDFNHNVTALTNAAGDVTDGFAWTPFGRSAGRTGDTNIPFGFAGGVGVMTDSPNSIYMRARYYHTGLRQFTSPDLIEGDLSRPQSLNRYAYIEGMAFGGVDPTGLFSWKQLRKGALTAGLGAVSFGGGAFLLSGGSVATATGVGAPLGVPAALSGALALKLGIAGVTAGFVQMGMAFSDNEEVHKNVNNVTGTLGTAVHPVGAVVLMGTAGFSSTNESIFIASDAFQSVVGIKNVASSKKSLSDLKNSMEFTANYYQAFDSVKSLNDRSGSSTKNRESAKAYGANIEFNMNVSEVLNFKGTDAGFNKKPIEKAYGSNVIFDASLENILNFNSIGAGIR